MTPTFSSLGVSEALVSALAERGIAQPFPIQSLTIADALAGRDVCGKAKTGSGKTLAFGVPVLQRLPAARPERPTGICLVPTRELAVQVRDELEPLGKAVDRTVGALYGGDPIDKQIKMLQRGLDLAICTPGRVIDLIERGALDVSEITHVVVDEADRMADMGFLPQVEWILRNVKGDPQTLLFSATLDGVVDSLAPGSGSAFSLLPADNATGNFVRVVQRVPVKIRLVGNPLPGRLVPGLSARVEIVRGGDQ